MHTKPVSLHSMLGNGYVSVLTSNAGIGQKFLREHPQP